MRIKVLFVLTSLSGGGAERVFTCLLNHLDRNNFEPHLALGSLDPTDLKDLEKDIPIYKLKGKRARSAVFSLVKLVRDIKPDTVFSTLGMNFANLLAKSFYPSNTKVVLREGNTVTPFLKDVARHSPARALSYRYMYRLAYHRSDAIICQSDFMLRDMVANTRVNKENLHRIYNPVDFNRVGRFSNEKSEDLFPNNFFNFVTAGNLSYSKGFDILLEAFAQATKTNDKIKLTIFGEGVERMRLEQLRSELGLVDSVRMPGFVKHPYRYFKQADAFVSSSRYEGFANVISESLACGTPIVATDCPSAIREVIREGENGWFAKAENSESLANTLLKAIHESKGIDRMEIRKRCHARFSVEQILPQYEKILGRGN